ncbi:erythromycin esterase family protein [Paenibacillus lignilyticus]|uniref:Erythromycin esterase family protein n=1 Tax=Paenibacillus lignilyticus TaxID=1172615 RepID=A0ABS5CD19_9BACL|nr:erythromycin esterase family protein [Paenibacillus lignilyticus]MBP3963881.1 erythromycin esterase family protein [Paenibacillus lignilyticus]
MSVSGKSNNREEIVDAIKQRANRLEQPADLQHLANAAGGSKFVLLGEASHGTSEFYTNRTALSQMLIEQHQFSFIAVEGDWPSCYEVNKYVKHHPEAKGSVDEVLQAFDRWPSWMWANRETVELITWLREYNRELPEQYRIGFYGLDVYSLWESMDEIIKHLKKTNSPELAAALNAFSCFEPHSRDGQNYGMSAAFFSELCQDEVLQLLRELEAKRNRAAGTHEALLNDEINALVAVNAERYYQAMVKGGPDSWNIRDRHMVEALNRVMQFYGPSAKAIVWEHNTHIGDARATDMEADHMVNVGQLLREQSEEIEVYAIGFGTFSGTVIAADAWESPAEVLRVPEARRGSWEELMHEAGPYDQWLIFRGTDTEVFHHTYGHRAIGVVYHPHYERGNYVPSVMAERYDAFVYIDRSNALQPLVPATV